MQFNRAFKGVVAALMFGGALLSFAATPSGKAKTKEVVQAPPPEVKAPDAEVLAAVKAVSKLADDCRRALDVALIVNNLQKSYSRAEWASKAAADQASRDRVAASDKAHRCAEDGKEKITESGRFVIDELRKRGQQPLGKDYIVQALTAIEATHNEDLHKAEFSKLNALRNRIEMEIKLAPQ